MAAFREGKVIAVDTSSEDRIVARVGLAGGEIDALGYPGMLGGLAAGDRVIVNTTGLDLELGTGGTGFILWNLDGREVETGAGHIVKLRYTPWQTEVLAAEAPESEFHLALAEADTLEGTPVVACGLHSQIAGVAAGIKATRPDARVAYAMSDAGAIPIAWSDLVRELRSAGLLDVTVTYGHAIGGDIEAVNVFSALVAARVVGHADVIVAAMGPGGVGTGTKLGFSGIEQGQVLDAAASLHGRPVACVRISFDDARTRHQGISHHGMTTLTMATSRRASVVLPTLAGERMRILRAQLAGAGLDERHEVVESDGRPGVERLRAAGLDPATMGRSLSVAAEPFLAAAAAGRVAAELL